MNSMKRSGRHPAQRGVGLIEVMISIVIAMLLVLVIYQVYELSEGQKRTITAGSDAQQNATYALHVLTRDVAVAGNGIASAAAALDGCAMLRPIPVIINAGATGADPDSIKVLYGGSSSLATPVPFRNSPTTAQDYQVPGPVGFSVGDVIAAVQLPPGTNCTLSTIDAVAVNSGVATLTHTPITGNIGVSYASGSDSVVNLGKSTCPGPPSQQATLGKVLYSVDPTTHALRTQNLLNIVCATPATPPDGPVNPVVSDVVNLKAQYGLDTDNNGIVDTWQDAATGNWTAANLPLQPLATLRQIRAIRVAIVTRSAQFEKDTVTPGPLGIFCDTPTTCAVSMTLAAADQHYRYKILETIVPLRNALWNPS